jgi:hypothetical protein
MSDLEGRVRTSLRRASALAVALGVVVATAGTAAARPGATGGAVLGATNTITASRSAAMDVVVPRAFTLDPALFDVPASNFTTSRVGSGFSLIGLTGSAYPPTLVGMSTPEGSSAHVLLFPFGEDGKGGDAFESRRFPAGRYRLTVFTSGPVTMRFALHLPGRPTVLRPDQAAPVVVHRQDAPAQTLTGSVLGDTAPVSESASWLAVTTVAGHLAPSLTGYESYWCRYDDGPPPAGYQPKCLGGHGIGVAWVGPLVDFHYSGFSAFVGLPPKSKLAVSRSLQGAGVIEDQSSLFIWVPMPAITRPAAAGSLPAMVTLDNRTRRV